MKKEEKNQPQMAKVTYLYVMGKKYEMPERINLMGGFEYEGYLLKRGISSSGGT